MSNSGRSRAPRSRAARRGPSQARPSAADRGLSVLGAILGTGLGLAGLTWGAGRHRSLTLGGQTPSAVADLLTLAVLFLGIGLLLCGTLSIVWSATGYTLGGTALTIGAAAALMLPQAWLPALGTDQAGSPAAHFTLTGIYLAAGLLLLVLGGAGRAARRAAFANPDESRGAQRLMSSLATVVLGLVGITGFAFGTAHIYPLRTGWNAAAAGSARWTPYLIAAVGLALLLIAASCARWSGLGPMLLGVLILVPNAVALASPATMVKAFGILPEIARAEVTLFVNLDASLVIGLILLGAGVGITIARTRAETKTLAGRHGERGYYLP